MILVAGLAVVGLAGIAAAFYFSIHPGGTRVRTVTRSRAGRAGDSRLPAGRGRTSQPPAGRSGQPASPARSARSAGDASPARSARSAGDASPARSGRSAGDASPARSAASAGDARPPRSARSAGDASPARSARSVADPSPARSARSAGDTRSGSGRAIDRTGSSTVIDLTGPQRILDDSEPVVTGRRARHGDRKDDAPKEARPTHRIAPRRSHAPEPDDGATTPRSRRRVAWRKGSDVDEELWPAEAFGGVSDEQFWDDLAADKPLATTARAAQPDPAASRRPPGSPLPDLYPADDRGPGNSAGGKGGGRGGPAKGSGTHPQPRLGPDDRTAIQPAQGGTQPSPTSPVATQPYPTATQPSPTATQPVRATRQPAESRGRPRSATSANEDPLTSPAYSLRPKGSVNGQSYPSSRQSRDLTREQYETAGKETQTFSRAGAQAAGGGYPDGVPSSRQLDRPSHGTNGRGRSDAGRTDPDRPDPLRPGSAYGGTVPNALYPHPQQPNTAPGQLVNGEEYGYGLPAGSWAQGAQGAQGLQGAQGVQAAPGGDPRRANGGWSPGRPGGSGAHDGNRGPRPAYPMANGYRAPYDPRGYDRR